MPKPADIPPCPAPPRARSSGRSTREYQISLITPLFGGGVEAGALDESLPIRGTAIRGQLQFWWRATRGADVASYKDLFVRHAEIWGTTDRASPVEIEIHHVNQGPSKPCAQYMARGEGRRRLQWEILFGGANRELAYALFPFQGQLNPDGRTIEKQPARFIETASFTLRLRYPEALRQDLETAVRAWVNFGGLGARTRRGCGALFCKELVPADLDDLARQLRTWPVNRDGTARDWPTMPAGLLVGSRPEAAVDAWKKVIGLLQTFRQGEGVARNPGTQPHRPGRSRYPEPETIRRVTGRRAPQHPRLPHIPDDAFPRAELGLPIVFHFQGGDEPDTSLYPPSGANGETRERMASPLVLKPLALADGNAIPMIVPLVTPPLRGVVLKQGSNQLRLPETSVVRAERLAKYPNSPLAGSASGSALDAFLLHARNHGFREITR